MASAGKTAAPSAILGLLQSAGLPAILTLAAVLIGLAALLPLIQTSGATSTAGRIQSLEQEKDDWQARLQEIEVEVARLGSLDRIEQEARTRLGMEEPKDVHYLNVDVPAPEPHKIPSRYLPQEPVAGESSPSLWEEVFGWLPLP